MWVDPIYEGEYVELSNILRDEVHPEWGFKKDVLPEHITNVSMNEEEGDRVVLSYVKKLNHGLEKKYWEGKGYSTRTLSESMQVVDKDGKVVATYCLNRILIEMVGLDQFIENMR